MGGREEDSLHNFVQSEKTGPAEIKEVMKMLAQLLNTLHTMGLVHGQLSGKFVRVVMSETVSCLLDI